MTETAATSIAIGGLLCWLALTVCITVRSLRAIRSCRALLPKERLNRAIREMHRARYASVPTDKRGAASEPSGNEIARALTLLRNTPEESDTRPLVDTESVISKGTVAANKSDEAEE